MDAAFAAALAAELNSDDGGGSGDGYADDDADADDFEDDDFVDVRAAPKRSSKRGKSKANTKAQAKSKSKKGKGGGKAKGKDADKTKLGKGRGSKRNRKTAEERHYEKLVKETLQERLPDVPEGTVRQQIGHPAEEDLKKWSHHHGVDTIDDDVLKVAGEGLVSFVFGLHVEGKDLSLFKEVPAAKPAVGAGRRLPMGRGRGPGRGGMLVRPAGAGTGAGAGAGGPRNPLARRRFPPLHARSPTAKVGTPKPMSTPAPSTSASKLKLADSVTRL